MTTIQEALERSRRLHNERIEAQEQRHVAQGHSDTSGAIVCPTCRAEMEGEAPLRQVGAAIARYKSLCRSSEHPGDQAREQQLHEVVRSLSAEDFHEYARITTEWDRAQNEEGSS